MNDDNSKIRFSISRLLNDPIGGGPDMGQIKCNEVPQSLKKNNHTKTTNDGVREMTFASTAPIPETNHDKDEPVVALRLSEDYLAQIISVSLSMVEIVVEGRTPTTSMDWYSCSRRSLVDHHGLFLPQLEWLPRQKWHQQQHRLPPQRQNPDPPNFHFDNHRQIELCVRPPQGWRVSMRIGKDHHHHDDLRLAPFRYFES